MMVSAIGASLGYLVFSTHAIPAYIGIEVESLFYNWIPVISSFWIIFFASLGMESLTYTIITEIMPEKVKDAGLTFCGALQYLITFIYIMLANLGVGVFGLGFVAIISPIICLAGAKFIHLKMPETKGKNQNEIMKSF